MLSDSVVTLKGVGEKVKEDLHHMDIYTIEDLLEHFPFRYDVVELKPLHELIHDDQVTITGEVIYPPTVTYYGRKKSRLQFNVQVDQVTVKAVMFNRTFAKKHLNKGTTVTLTGKWDAHRLQITVNHYQLGELNKDVAIKAIYSVKGSITSGRVASLINQALKENGHFIKEILPPSYLQKYKIPSRNEAIRWIHRPENQAQLKHGRRRFVYEELLLFQLKMHLLKQRTQLTNQGFEQRFDEKKVTSFINKMPFKLTEAQETSLKEILADMKAPIQMNRLLQGDVGSGKTAVASICLYATINANFQGAFMVPTEILAEQHYDSIKEIFGREINIALLTSSVKGKKRKEILEGIKQHDINLVIGTHSLIQEEVVFHRLGLVIIDEQHRFGVEQRKALREKGLQPDVLFMTATPIPRTLAITAFGDMDISVIDQLPIGRKEVETYWIKENMLTRVLEFIKQRVNAGEQAYIVSPLIEESEAFDYQNAIDLFYKLQDYYGEELKIGLLHGKLPANEKESIMKQFMRNDLQILVATTVIEVGVNVPNATVMLIYDAERFGLSQLHQLRGRVGRGDRQSYCILLADPKGEIGKERMRIMTETTDGFRLAEEDLKLRGPGDFFGKKQSGLPEFKVADLVHDYRALEVARNDAKDIVERKLLENNLDFKQLKEQLEEVSFDQRFD